MNDSFKNFLKYVLVAVVTALLTLTIWFWIIYPLYLNRIEERPFVDPHLYQAVFLDGNQNYFGHLQNFGTDNPYLTDVYYVKATAPNEEKPGEQFSLVKMGNEVHGPEDVLHFNSERMLFWQNLNPNSKVVQGIAKEKAQRAGNAAP